MLKQIIKAGFFMALSAAASQPAGAASLDGATVEQRSMGAFAGARLQIPMGATTKASAGLTLAPTQRAALSDGAVRTRFGEGLALGVIGGDPIALRLAGTRVDRLQLAGGGKLDGTGQRHGVSTLGYVAIGAGILLVGAFIAYGAIGDAATE